MKKILFLDDNLELCKMYAQIVLYLGDFHAEFCSTPQEIKLALNESKWDLIISDLDIPGVTTAEIIATAKSRLVFLTGGESNSETSQYRVYRKDNLMKTLPKIFEENLGNK